MEGHLGARGSGVDRGGPEEQGRLHGGDKDRRTWERKGVPEDTQGRNQIE